MQIRETRVYFKEIKTVAAHCLGFFKIFECIVTITQIVKRDGYLIREGEWIRGNDRSRGGAFYFGETLLLLTVVRHYLSFENLPTRIAGITSAVKQFLLENSGRRRIVSCSRIRPTLDLKSRDKALVDS